MLSFSVIIFCSAIEIDLYSLNVRGERYIQFKLKFIRLGNKNYLPLASQAVYKTAPSSRLHGRASCAVRMQNAVQKYHRE